MAQKTTRSPQPRDLEDNSLNRSRIRFWKSENGKKLSSTNRIITSWDVLAWVAHTSLLRGTPRLVAFQLASAYNAKNKNAKLSVSVLAELIGCSRSAASQAVNALVDSGEWEVRKKFDSYSNKHMVNVYYPKFDATKTVIPVEGELDRDEDILEGLSAPFLPPPE